MHHGDWERESKRRKGRKGKCEIVRDSLLIPFPLQKPHVHDHIVVNFSKITSSTCQNVGKRMSLLRFVFYRKFVQQELSKNVIRASSSSSSSRTPTTSLVSPRRTHDALIDTFGRQHFYLRISLTERCNLRCAYCMPKDGVNLTDMDQLLTVEEQKRIITIFTRLGVTKIRFTGGEPTLNKQLPELIRHASLALKTTSRISDDDEPRHSSSSLPTPIPGTIGMTTNGLVLQHQLERLVEAGLSSVNISLDTLQLDKFATITRRDKKGWSPYHLLFSCPAVVYQHIRSITSTSFLVHLHTLILPQHTLATSITTDIFYFCRCRFTLF